MPIFLRSQLLYADCPIFNHTRKNKMPHVSDGAQKQLGEDAATKITSSQPDITVEKVSSLSRTVAQQAEEIRNLRNRNAELRAEIQRRDLSKDDILVTALMHAAADGNMETVKFLIEDEATLRDRHGKTAIMYAASHDQKDVVELLLPLEGDIMDNEGRYALYYSLESGSLATSEYLIEHTSSTDTNGATALMRAVAENNAKMVSLLIPIQKGMQTTASGELTLKCGRCRFHKGTTALMLAIRYGYLDMAKNLLEHEKGKKDSHDWTALMWAAHCGCTEILKDLVGSETGMQSLNGWTALMLAAYNDHTDAVSELIESEAGLCAKDGSTALIAAAKRGNHGSVELLIEKQATLVDSEGRTALMWAAHNNHLECVKLLAEKEKEIKSASKWVEVNGKSKVVHQVNSTALDIAKNMNHQEIVAFLSASP